MRVLVVDDELSMREYLDVLIGRAGHEVVLAGTVNEATTLLADRGVDLVITDMKLGTESGMSVVKAARSHPSPPEVIVITAFGTPAAAVEAMREGAYDYICKPFDNEEFLLLVRKALEKRELLEENRHLRRSLQAGGGAKIWVGKSPHMSRVMSTVEKVAVTRSTVLIVGESGTGKELVARSIHSKGARAGQPFIPVNCAALAEGVLESELFGHVKGAFTGATSDRRGILAAAGEGTVFLDEIGEVPLSTQVKLLRVLQERRVKPVGSADEVAFHARVLAATNRDLEADVKAGRFREDLLYRLNVITIELPPLRERREDIGDLANIFLAQVADELGRPNLRFSPEALALLARYRFPGNVRQLQNVVERAATLAEADVLGPETLPPPVRGDAAAGGEPAGAPVSLPERFSLEQHLDELERKFLLEGLARAGGVKTKAAELLGLSFRSFRYRLAKHGLSDGAAGSPD